MLRHIVGQLCVEIRKLHVERFTIAKDARNPFPAHFDMVYLIPVQFAQELRIGDFVDRLHAAEL